MLATLIPSHTGFSSSFRSHAARNDRPPHCTHCIHGGLAWVATWLVLVYIMCCGTARDCVTATISARDSKYRFRTHIPLVDRGTPPGPTAEIFRRLWTGTCIYHAVALRHMRRRQMRAMVALRSVWLVLHYTCAIRLAPSAGFAPCDLRGISPVHPHVHLISIETVYCSHFCMRMALDILTCSTMAHHDPSVCFMDDHFTVTTLQQLDTIHNVR